MMEITLIPYQQNIREIKLKNTKLYVEIIFIQISKKEFNKSFNTVPQKSYLFQLMPMY